ncbi:hypothetical protein, partial [Sedimenticola sp.]|uniref:hypothetical protein n=1 Tax=Sedimenticola sp. TaxID=1940285 RepID=UPI002FF8C2DE|nr:hypothetical protein [Sedimenticola sp.]
SGEQSVAEGATATQVSPIVPEDSRHGSADESSVVSQRQQMPDEADQLAVKTEAPDTEGVTKGQVELPHDGQGVAKPVAKKTVARKKRAPVKKAVTRKKSVAKKKVVKKAVTTKPTARSTVETTEKPAPARDNHPGSQPDSGRKSGRRGIRLKLDNESGIE